MLIMADTEQDRQLVQKVMRDIGLSSDKRVIKLKFEDILCYLFLLLLAAYPLSLITVRVISGIRYITRNKNDAEGSSEREYYMRTAIFPAVILIRIIAFVILLLIAGYILDNRL